MSMNQNLIDKYVAAILEAERFIAKADAAQIALTDDDMIGIVGSKETAAAKRSSMDLTRALADLRNPNK